MGCKLLVRSAGGELIEEAEHVLPDREHSPGMPTRGRIDTWSPMAPVDRNARKRDEKRHGSFFVRSSMMMMMHLYHYYIGLSYYGFVLWL